MVDQGQLAGKTPPRKANKLTKFPHIGNMFQISGYTVQHRERGEEKNFLFNWSPIFTR